MYTFKKLDALNASTSSFLLWRFCVFVIFKLFQKDEVRKIDLKGAYDFEGEKFDLSLSNIFYSCYGL